MSHPKQQLFVCLDCESTGLEPTDQIIEVAVAVFSLEEELSSFESLVDPEMNIPPASIAIHHITDEMVQGKPKIADLLPDLLKLIARHPIVGHNIQFDIDLIKAAADKHAIPHHLSSNPAIDTLRMARRYGESPVNSLEELGRHFNVKRDEIHRAMADVRANVAIFRHLFKAYKNLHHLYDTLKKPVLMKTMPLGKYKGRLIKDIPLEYLLWAARKDFDQDLLFSLRSEIKRRKQGNLFFQAGNPFSNL